MDSLPAQPSLSSQTPIVEPQKSNLKKFLDRISWIIFFTLLPFAVLIFLSQDSIPGDFFYPVKRGLESVILAAASVNPATRAAFRTDLTERRFEEAQSLVISESNTSGLSTFIDDVQGTQLEVANLKDETQRIKAEEKLITKLGEYQAGLSAMEAKTEQNIIAYQAQEIVLTSTPIPPTAVPDESPSTLTPSPTPTPKVSYSTAKVSPTLTPSSTPIPTTTSIQIPSPTVAPTTAISQVIPTSVRTSTRSIQVLEQKKISETIKETREQLKKIKKELEEKKKENRDKPDENKEKENSNEKSETPNSNSTP